MSINYLACCNRFLHHFGGWGSFLFALGWLLVGALLTYLMISGQSHGYDNFPSSKFRLTKLPQQYHGSLLSSDYYQNKEEEKIVGTNSPNEIKEGTKLNKTVAGMAEDLLAHRSDNQDLADLLAKHIRVLCMVLTTQKNHKEKAVYVKNTWGRRCTKLVFLSDVEDPSLPSIKASSQTDWDHVWSKVRGGFRWAYKNHLDDFDWFMKADDDTFFIMENLRALLVQFNPDKEAVYVGREFSNPSWKDPKSYYSGGSGYVLSRQAVRKLVEEAFPLPKYCRRGNFEGPEDVEMGRCLEHVGILTTDTRDDIGRQRFLPLSLDGHLKVGYADPDFWLLTYDKYPYKEGEECCSSLAISFHYITPDEMVQIEYLLYRLHQFGRNVFVDGRNVGEKSAYKLLEEKLTANNYSGDITAVNKRTLDNSVEASAELTTTAAAKEGEIHKATETPKVLWV